MRNVKKVLAGVTAIAALFSMAACGGSGDSESADSNKLTVAWWGNQDRNERQDKVNKAFEAANEGVTVEGQFSEWDDYWKKLQTSAASNDMPDVIAMDYSYLQQYVDNNLIIPLDEYVDSGTIKTDGIDDTVLASGTMDDKLYALSTGSSAPAMIYNKTVLDKAGIEMPESLTLDEFEAMAKKVYEKTGYKTNFRYYEASELLEYVLRGEGKTLFDSDKLGVDASDVEPYFKVYQDGIEQGWHVAPEVFTEVKAGSVEQDPLVYGDDPASKSWVSFKFTSQMPAMQAVTEDDLALAPYPSADLKKADYVKPGQFFAITKSCKNPELAAKYIDYYTNNTDAVKAMGTDRGLPVASASLEAITNDLEDDEKEVVDFMNNVVIPNASAINPPAPTAAATVNTETLPTVEEDLLYKKIKATDAAKRFVQESNEALAE